MVQKTVVNQEKLDKMEDELSDLAYRWRGSQDKALVDKYQKILLEMIKLGCDYPVSFDAELPDEHMPKEYLKMHR